MDHTIQSREWNGKISKLCAQEESERELNPHWNGPSTEPLTLPRITKVGCESGNRDGAECVCQVLEKRQPYVMPFRVVEIKVNIKRWLSPEFIRKPLKLAFLCSPGPQLTITSFYRQHKAPLAFLTEGELCAGMEGQFLSRSLNEIAVGLWTLWG